MAWFALGRVVFVATVAYVAALLQPIPVGGLPANALFGLVLAGVVVALERPLRQTPPSRLLGALLGFISGLVIARAIEAGLFWADFADHRIEFLHGFLLIVLPYLGLVFGAKNGEWLEPLRLASLFHPVGPERRYKILDTSVIIDGRIADVCETGFIDGTLVIPQFVLKELQLVADSGDSMKRNRGRRGLDILQKIQKMASVEVTISDVDFPEVREVDLKLIELARTLQGKIVTNDFNLNKVAQLRGVDVLNVNELANSLKPVVLARRADESVHPQRGQGVQPGRGLSRRWDDGRGRQCTEDDQQDHRHRCHQRAADHGRQDDLRPLYRGGRGRAGHGAAAAGATAGARGRSAQDVADVQLGTRSQE